jgi:hypothetical protein
MGIQRERGMSPAPHYAAKRDAVEPGIVAVFQEADWYVQPLNGKGLPDLLTGPRRGPLLLVECKSGNAGLTPDQKTWHGEYHGWPVQIVRNEAQARKLVRMVEIADAVERNTPTTWDEAVEASEAEGLAELRTGKDTSAGGA